ncbi:hypothetical protein AV530_017003 [Patagioenas fasciata monilis]|uniref:Uncharacterized protein n=1 Tax=Patagioenas fasciata monilis TaxID=372326 RepID=A0A1V4J5P3_PATFA|nr:hypothetical protein AV530_017003 [Patagioenas fasciata monilis]
MITKQAIYEDAEQLRSLHRPHGRSLLSCRRCENWLSAPDLRFLFFSPLSADSRTHFLTPEWLRFLRSFFCRRRFVLSSSLG